MGQSLVTKVIHTTSLLVVFGALYVVMTPYADASPIEIGVPISETGIIQQTTIDPTGIGGDGFGYANFKDESTLCNTSWTAESYIGSYSYETSFGCNNPAQNGTYTTYFVKNATSSLDIGSICYTGQGGSLEECIQRADYVAYHIRSGGVWIASTTAEVPLDECTECTRVVSTDPTAGETIVATSTNYLTEHVVYVNTGDYWDDHTYTRMWYTKQFGVDRDVQQQFDTLLLNDATSTVFNYVDSFNEEGSYSLVVQIYKDSWFTFENILETYNINFQVGTSTTMEERVASDQATAISSILDSVNCEVSFLTFGLDGMKCIRDYVWAIVVPPSDIFTSMVRGHFNYIVHLPPWGYGARIVEILNTESVGTTTLALTHTFQAGMPGEGAVLTLDADTAITDAIANIRAMEVPTINGDPFDKFMFYWETLWYILFGLWLLKTVYGEFGLNFTNDKESLFYGHSGNGRLRETKNERFSRNNVTRG